MDYMAEVYLGYKTIHIDELIGPKGKGQRSNARPAAGGSVRVRRRRRPTSPCASRTCSSRASARPACGRCSREVEMPLVRVLAEMEMNGVRIDTASLKETSQMLTQRMNDIEQKIYQLAGDRVQHSLAEAGGRSAVRQDENRG